MPLWNAMGKKAVYCGESGNGQKAKYALNLAQTLVIDAMIEILDTSGAKNGVASFKLPYIMERDFNPHFKYKLMHKDLKIAEKEMQKLNLNLVKLLEEEARFKVKINKA